LGNSNTADRLVPINISSIVGSSLIGRTIVAISAGFFHSMAVDSTGQVHTWGFNAQGRLGNDSTTDSWIPINVSSFGSLVGKTIVAIGANAEYSTAVDSAGVVHTWGRGGDGRLGNNSTLDTPVRIPTKISSFGTINGKRIVDIATGHSHTLAIDSTGAIHAWGWNGNSQLGDNLLNSRSRAYQVNTSYAPVAASPIFVNFTGQHRCYIDVPRILPEHEGLVVVTDKNVYVTPDLRGRRAIQVNSALPLVSLSSIPKDRRVFGVISFLPDIGTTSATSDEIQKARAQGDVRVEINSLGEGALWVCDAGGSGLQAGDLVTTSVIPGYAMLQDDDIMRTYTVAKLTMDCDFQPPMIEVQRRALDHDGNLVVDENGAPIWEIVMHDEQGTVVPAMEPMYDIRYIDNDGRLITKEEYDTSVSADPTSASRAAFLGCTYHCG
jgi:hypothetical protein